MNIAPVSQAFASSEELLYAWENVLEMDMLFLDIQIPGEMSGLEVAKAIRKVDSQICIAFTTSYSEYACEGYSVSALRYLRKPIADEQLFECLDIAYQQWVYRQDSSIFLDAQRRKLALHGKLGHPSQEPDKGKEVRIVPVAIADTFGDLDFVVEAFKFASRNRKYGMSHEARKALFFQ